MAATRTKTPLMREMRITDPEIERRKEFLEFTADDAERLTSVNDLAQQYADPVIEAFYRHLLTFEDTRAFFQDPKILEYVKGKQKQYFLRLTEGRYEQEYVENRLTIGAVHDRIGLPVKSYLGMYSFYLREVAARFQEANRDDLEQAFRVFLSLMKLVFLDIGLAIDTYIFQRERAISEQQQRVIRELSTPVLQLRERLLILPIVGVIDSERARQLTENLLHSIRATRAKVVVIDITGVPDVDSGVANHLVQTVEASRLMGGLVIVTGLSAEVAQTLANLGVDLTKLNTVGDLQGGIEEADRLLGYRVVADEDSHPESS